jgi:hypothetical protein
MFGSQILDVAIGIIFVYMVVSIICTAVREGIEAWLKTRAAYLEHGIRQILQDPKGIGLAKDLFEHPLIFGLFTANTYKPGPNREEPTIFQRGTGLPSYIPSHSFAAALLDIVAHGPQALNSDSGGPPLSLLNVRRGARGIQNPAVRRVVINALDSAQGDLTRAQKAIEDWFDSAMDRVSGWYKR